MHTLMRAAHAFIAPADARRSRSHDRCPHTVLKKKCPSCGGKRVTGDKESWICHNCGSQGQR